MFDSVLDRGQGPKSRVGVGAVISVVLHVGIFVLAVWLSTRPPKEKEKEVEVTFKQAMAPPMNAAPPPPPPPPAAHHKTNKKVVKKPDTIVQPKEIPQQKPPEVDPPDSKDEEEASEEEVEGGVEGGVAGGVVGGVIGGVVGGVLGGQGGTGTDVLPFGAGMTRPDKLSGPQPQYTREALEAHVQGLMIVKCVITTEGNVERCRIIKPLPHMEQAVLDALYAQRYKPVTFQGRPVQVDYTFNIRLNLPH